MCGHLQPSQGYPWTSSGHLWVILGRHLENKRFFVTLVRKSLGPSPPFRSIQGTLLWSCSITVIFSCFLHLCFDYFLENFWTTFGVIVGGHLRVIVGVIFVRVLRKAKLLKIYPRKEREELFRKSLGILTPVQDLEGFRNKPNKTQPPRILSKAH